MRRKITQVCSMKALAIMASLIPMISPALAAENAPPAKATQIMVKDKGAPETMPAPGIVPGG
jgi:hypothetical protein